MQGARSLPSSIGIFVAQPDLACALLCSALPKVAQHPHFNQFGRSRYVQEPSSPLLPPFLLPFRHLLLGQLIAPGPTARRARIDGERKKANPTQPQNTTTSSTSLSHSPATMSSALARPLFRRTAAGPSSLRSVAARRFESSASSQAQKASETAKNAASEYKTKATEGLSRVTSAAGPAIAGAAQGVSSALGKVGGRTGKVIGFVQRMLSLFSFSSPLLFWWCLFARCRWGGRGVREGGNWMKGWFDG